MEESKAMLEIREIRNKNAEKTKDMTLKEKIDYLFKKGEQARKNLDLKSEFKYSEYPILKENLFISEETTEYKSSKKSD